MDPEHFESSMREAAARHEAAMAGHEAAMARHEAASVRHDVKMAAIRESLGSISNKLDRLVANRASLQESLDQLRKQIRDGNASSSESSSAT